MNKALIDTTILTDVLLNSGQRKKDAEKALRSFDETHLPVFAIKEFRAGPLSNFAWMHNNLVSNQSLEKALDHLQKMSRSLRRYTTSTALQSLKEATGSIAKQTLGDLVQKYGKAALRDTVECDEFRLAIKTKIMCSWKKRRKVTTNIVYPLPCFQETAPRENRGLIVIEPKKCDVAQECALSPLIRRELEQMKAMRESIKDSDKRENIRRAKTMKQIYRTPNRTIAHEDCRNMGDALFVLMCPENCVILTTNVSDYAPLSKSVGKNAVSPTPAK